MAQKKKAWRYLGHWATEPSIQQWIQKSKMLGSYSWGEDQVIIITVFIQSSYPYSVLNLCKLDIVYLLEMMAQNGQELGSWRLTDFLSGFHPIGLGSHSGPTLRFILSLFIGPDHLANYASKSPSVHLIFEGSVVQGHLAQNISIRSNNCY